MKKPRKLEICSVCGENKPVEKRGENGEAICKKCYQRTHKRKEENCILCGEFRPVQKRDENGNAICMKCYLETYIPKEEICCICGELEKVAKRDKNKEPICIKCYKHPKKNCGGCGEEKVINKIDNGVNLCKKCYRKTIPPKREICSICGKDKIVNYRSENGEAICSECGIKKDICVECGEFGPVKKRDENGNPICNKCYDKSYVRKKGICKRCNKLKKIDYRDDSDNVFCHSCYKLNRMDIDPKFRVIELLRSRFQQAFKFYSTTGKVKKSKDYGIDYEAIFNYLGPCPGPRTDYQIDHILPLSAFDFDNPIHIRAAFAPENHRWLPAAENLSKNDNYDKEELEKYLLKFGG